MSVVLHGVAWVLFPLVFVIMGVVYWVLTFGLGVFAVFGCGWADRIIELPADFLCNYFQWVWRKQLN